MDNYPPGFDPSSLDIPEPTADDPYSDLDELRGDLETLIDYVNRTDEQKLRKAYLLQEIELILGRLDSYLNE